MEKLKLLRSLRYIKNQLENGNVGAILKAHKVLNDLIGKTRAEIEKRPPLLSRLP
jgi:hypothetical protein